MSSNLLTDIQRVIGSNLNIDNLRNNYYIVDLNAIFKSPAFGQLEQQKDFLIQNSKVIDMEPRYEQRPEYVSWDEYGTVNLAPIILFINDVFSRPDFTMDEIIVPNPDYLEQMISESPEFFNKYFFIHSRELRSQR